MTLLKAYNIPFEGKKALVVGRSMLVGKPTAMLLLKENATVTIAHSKSKNLKQLCLDSDIIVVAVGSPKIIKKGFFKKGQVIVDVGTNAVVGPKILEEDVSRKLVGDVDFEEAKKVVKAISPVPGGVGPMTVASLFENLVEVAKK
jgi:methylenetetrahydrofolate dehydrogenase (NADP+)/methenyltetrahydrofolate cyclohydrolase